MWRLSVSEQRSWILHPAYLPSSAWLGLFVEFAASGENVIDKACDGPRGVDARADSRHVFLRRVQPDDQFAFLV
jgi:hypothetical protein